ncbi:MAG: LuxR C-terminal-related transcriptional regulator [Parvularculaceae bacterium]|nr:LuxR C-terminal-related transcriptional regulator [Parvularculaceae bacterium]
MTASDIEPILDEVYASMIIRGDFVAPLSRLLDLIGSHAGTVLEPNGDFLKVRALANLDDRALADYNRHFHLEDPWIGAHQTRGPDEILIGSRCASPDDVDGTDFYKHIMKPNDMWDMMNAKISGADGAILFISTYTPKGRLFSDAERRTVAAFGSHVSRAWRLSAALAPGGFDTARLDAAGFTPTERRVVDLMLEGCSNAEISARAGMTPNTLKWHARNIFSKFGVRSKAALIAKAAGRRGG